MNRRISPELSRQDHEAITNTMMNSASKSEKAFSNEDSSIPPPPAHLQARLNRTRAKLSRRSSASTSRRNSLSSVHSRASEVSRSRNARLGLQNHSIAQHLRRASILESRRARLADRAAHAEQVRLRAALVKATPRATLSNSEEKTLAAQLAKEKYLAKVAATCAEEVARAKRIAEEVKGRREAEETRARLEMEERHAEAEKRRQEFQRNLQARRARRADSASRKLAVVEEDTIDEETRSTPVVLDQETAARRIQNGWVCSQKRAVVNAYLKLDINIRQFIEKTFEDLSILVADDAVITTTTRMLTQMGLQESQDPNASLNTRTFLSAYMLVAHPITVLNNRNGSTLR